MNDAIHCNALSVHAHNQFLLNDITFHIKRGEVVGLIGSNGAGKSTLLKALVGLIPGVTGNCQIFDMDYRQPSARQQLAFLSEKFQVASALTGRDFLKVMKCVDPNEELCQRFDFKSAWLKNPVKTYSKGMLQKLGLLYIFSSQKPLLIADELMSGLDMKTREAVYSHMHALKQQGVTILFSTHMTYDLNNLCDQVIALDQGKIQKIN